jgi:hypothetical protein
MLVANGNAMVLEGLKHLNKLNRLFTKYTASFGKLLP